MNSYLTDLKSTARHLVAKIEGFTFDASGAAYAVTDNDGLDGSNGETLFLSPGAISSSH